MDQRIVEAGDPVLRRPAALVAADKLGTPELQALIDAMVAAMRTAPGVGLAAPQIGVSLRVLVLEDNSERMAHLDAAELAARSRVEVPLTAIVNPVLRRLGAEEDTFFEGCLSVPGYSALVARARSVEVEGVTPEGEPLLLRASGWPARILQHEVDHLDGMLYVDRMLSRSLGTAEQIRERWAGRSTEEICQALGVQR